MWSFVEKAYWNLEMLIFEGRGKLESPEKNLLEQSKEPTTNLTHTWPRVLNRTPARTWEASAITTTPSLLPLSAFPGHSCPVEGKQTWTKLCVELLFSIPILNNVSMSMWTLLKRLRIIHVVVWFVFFFHYVKLSLCQSMLTPRNTASCSFPFSSLRSRTWLSDWSFWWIFISTPKNCILRPHKLDHSLGSHLFKCSCNSFLRINKVKQCWWWW